MQVKHLQLHKTNCYTLKTKSEKLAPFTSDGIALRDGYRIRIYADKAFNSQATRNVQREIDALNGAGTADQPLTFAEKIKAATPKAAPSLYDNIQAALGNIPSYELRTLEAATTQQMLPAMVAALENRITTAATAAAAKQAVQQLAGDNKPKTETGSGLEDDLA